ncbi:MAG: N-methyl-D-aspartate receptor NMDAR2C subunit, partial [Deltaproteobacteria bacterium]|nr:N-methyl-D-aspartate receptor NMDAR2C subunit [Deltaproteobacteria bacterium]
MADLNALSSRFERATRAAGAVRPGAAVFAELVARYAEPHRRYHTLSHIEACLAWLDWLSGVAERPQEVELALWFHDSIYELGGHENERRSAGLARERLGELGVDGQTVDRIAGHIEATKEHVAGAGDSALVVGIDLAILGARPLDFERFEREVR